MGKINNSTSKQVWSVLKPLLITLVLGYFAWLLITKNLQNVTWEGLAEALANVPAWRIATAVAMTALNYLVLVGYDAIALRYLEHSLSPSRTAFGSIVGYAFSHNFGWIAGGSAVRFRLYSQWGFSPLEIAKLIATLTITFWVGVFTLAGVAFVIDPPEFPKTILEYFPSWLAIRTPFPLGVISLLIIAGYLVLCAVWHQPLIFRGRKFVPPPFVLSVVQIVVASVEQLLAAGIFFVLLPDDVRRQLGFLEALDVYLMFTVVAALLHIPGGVVVLEKIVLDFIPAESQSALAASIVLYRLIFYLLPLAVAGMMLLGYEVRRPGDVAPAPVSALATKRSVQAERRKSKRR